MGSCAIEECSRPSRKRGWCRMHYERWRTHGDPMIVQKPRNRIGPDHPRWQGDAPTYNAAHLRVRRTLGKASAHPCVDACGSPARQWSYDHSDPNERRERLPPNKWGKSYEVAYSVDPAHYQPRCCRCHLAMDQPDRVYR